MLSTGSELGTSMKHSRNLGRCARSTWSKKRLRPSWTFFTWLSMSLTTLRLKSEKGTWIPRLPVWRRGKNRREKNLLQSQAFLELEPSSHPKDLTVQTQQIYQTKQLFRFLGYQNPWPLFFSLLVHLNMNLLLNFPFYFPSSIHAFSGDTLLISSQSIRSWFALQSILFCILLEKLRDTDLSRFRFFCSSILGLSFMSISCIWDGWHESQTIRTTLDWSNMTCPFILFVSPKSDWGSHESMNHHRLKYLYNNTINSVTRVIFSKRSLRNETIELKRRCLLFPCFYTAVVFATGILSRHLLLESSRYNQDTKDGSKSFMFARTMQRRRWWTDVLKKLPTLGLEVSLRLSLSSSGSWRSTFTRHQSLSQIWRALGRVNVIHQVMSQFLFEFCGILFNLLPVPWFLFFRRLFFSNHVHFLIRRWHSLESRSLFVLRSFGGSHPVVTKTRRRSYLPIMRTCREQWWKEGRPVSHLIF